MAGAYKAHRLAWFIHHGRWPAEEIDHINMVRDDNRLANLREASHNDNQHNRQRARADNKLGILGVSTYRGRFKAQIEINGENRYLGLFDTAEQAHTAYLEAKRTHHKFCTI